ncbi:MAG: nucleoside triphosphate pyrophosphohydrolase [Magnetococcales bacterium]|nr:nucleoside triphosphate pyrophosphohydrolase [Magnetococcales bacterium]
MTTKDPQPESTASELFQQLRALMNRLRGEDGCPWDRQQTFQSLTQYTIEEAFEVLEAVETNDLDELRQELGDLLFHVLFYSRIAEEQQLFTLEQVIDGILRKMIGRHPHVFAQQEGASATPVQQIIDNWEEHKRRERLLKSGHRPVSVFDGVSSHLPALIWADKIQDKMASVGFDWSTAAPVFDKVAEELEEVKQAAASGDPSATEEEIGDLLLTVVNLARHLDVNAEIALRRSAHKCQQRFRYIEQRLNDQGRSPVETSVDEMEQLWQASKVDR